MQNDTNTSVSSDHLLQLGRHCRWLNWADFRAAQLSGCLSESCYAEWQGTSGLAVYRYCTCLGVPGYYASYLEVAVPPLRRCSSSEATWKGWIFPFSVLKQINTILAVRNMLGCKPLWSLLEGSSAISESNILWEGKISAPAREFITACSESAV